VSDEFAGGVAPVLVRACHPKTISTRGKHGIAAAGRGRRLHPACMRAAL